MKRKTKILVLVLALTFSMVDTMYSQIFVAGESADNPRSKSEFFSGYQGGMTNGSNDENSKYGPGGGGGQGGVPLEGYTFLGSGAATLVGFAVLFLIAKRKKKGSSEPK